MSELALDPVAVGQGRRQAPDIYRHGRISAIASLT
jgi:hypothetical protein